MLPIKNILCATDFSDSSDFAFRVACALARDYEARLTVLHVVLPPLGAYGEGWYLPEDYGASQHDKLLQLQPHDPRVVTEHRLIEGEAVPTILRLAADMGADLIVMGTHGRKGFGRLLMGSVAEQVVRRAPCPVLTVKKPVTAAGQPAEAADELAAMAN
jgi:nucleotide-binding universal stress UspA family protein